MSRGLITPPATHVLRNLTHVCDAAAEFLVVAASHLHRLAMKARVYAQTAHDVGDWLTGLMDPCDNENKTITAHAEHGQFGVCVRELGHDGNHNDGVNEWL